MKLLQLAALFGGVVSATQPLAVEHERRALSDITTTVVLKTSTYTVTECATDAINCPASATVVQTSTTIVSVTTTICSLTSTPGAQPPASEVSPTSVVSSALPSGSVDVSVSIIPPSPTATISLPVESSIWVSVSIIPGDSSISLPWTTDTLSDAVPTSFSSNGLSSSVGYAPPHSSNLPSSSPSGTSTHSISISGTGGDPVSSVFITASVPGTPISTTSEVMSTSGSVTSNGHDSPSSSGAIPGVSSHTNTDSVPTSFPVSSAEHSSVGHSSSGYAVPSGSSSIPSNTNTDSIPTSFPVGSSSIGASSSDFVVAPSSSTASSDTLSGPRPSSSTLSGPDSTSTDLVQTTASTAHGILSGTSLTTLTGSLSSISGTHATLTSGSSGYATPPSPTESNSSEIDSTIEVTSYLTHTWTSFVTVQPSNSQSDTNTDTDAVPTIRPSTVSAHPSGYPTGSGNPYPSSNGTVVSPKPTYSEIPINMGHVVSVGKNSIAAIVVAFVFAHLA